MVQSKVGCEEWGLKRGGYGGRTQRQEGGWQRRQISVDFISKACL